MNSSSQWVNNSIINNKWVITLHKIERSMINLRHLFIWLEICKLQFQKHQWSKGVSIQERCKITPLEIKKDPLHPWGVQRKVPYLLLGWRKVPSTTIQLLCRTKEWKCSTAISNIKCQKLAIILQIVNLVTIIAFLKMMHPHQRSSKASPHNSNLRTGKIVELQTKPNSRHTSYTRSLWMSQLLIREI